MSVTADQIVSGMSALAKIAMLFFPELIPFAPVIEAAPKMTVALENAMGSAPGNGPLKAQMVGNTVNVGLNAIATEADDPNVTKAAALASNLVNITVKACNDFGVFGPSTITEQSTQ